MDNYRLWDTVEKKMVYSYTPEVDDSSREFYAVAYAIGYRYFKPEHFIIMRGLGLKDVLQREIYVGDQVIYGYIENGMVNYKHPLAMYHVTDDPFMIAHIAWQHAHEPGRGLIVTGNRYEGDMIWLNSNMVGTGM